MAKLSITVTKLPILYKKSSTGAILQWGIAVAGTTITVAHGQVGGKIQTGSEKIRSGKNAGRKNATAPADQALKEAKSQWTKKKKLGYVETLEAASAGETDALIEGGVLPMLAKVYEDEIEKITFPCSIQPKLDGHRCIAMIDESYKVTLWTRTRKPIKTMLHIEERLHTIAKSLKLAGTILDGELYNHELRNEFEKLTSAARKQDVSEEALKIQYHIYDMVGPECFSKRIGRLADVILVGGPRVDLVDTKTVHSHDEIKEFLYEAKKKGYEGAMVRAWGEGYQNKRSAQLLKVKTFEDAEFKIVGVKEGRGKLAGHGIFSCITPDGGEFDVKMAGPLEGLKKIWKDADSYLGEMLTVQYQGLTGAGIPRFPVGIRVREDL